jgi:Tol biopolymer transport system component
MQRYSIGFILLLSACSSAAAGSGADDTPIDAPIDSRFPIDAEALPDTIIPDAAPTPACDVNKPFGTPTSVANLNSTARDIQATIAGDGKLYLASDRTTAGNLDIFTSTASGTTWSTPVVLPNFNTAASETTPALTADALTMYYGTGATGDIYVTARANTATAFQVGTAVANVNDAGSDDGDVSVTGDGTLLYFSSNRSGVYKVYEAVKGGAGAFGAPTALATNGTVYDAHPRVTSDGLTMYYSSMRTDGGAQGGADIWVSKRASRAAVWGTPTRVAELNTAMDESPTYISTDGCVLLLQSNRAGGVGGQDIYEAKKPL